MFRTPDIPTREKKEFDPEEFEEEKLWIKRRKDGTIFSSVTPGGWKIVFGTAIIISLVIGGVLGAFLAYLTNSFLPLILLPTVVYAISHYFLSSDFATVEIDPERQLILYNGVVNFGGDYRTTRYRGTIKIITGTQLVRFKLLFGRKSRPYIRFITNSGYLRINYDPKKDTNFLSALNDVGLIDLEKMQYALINNNVVKNTDLYIAYYIKKFDRSEYFARLKQKRQDEKNQQKILKKMKRRELIDKSKKFRDTEPNTTKTNPKE